MSQGNFCKEHNIAHCTICGGAQSVLPHDVTRICLTDGTPVTEDYAELRPDGQQKEYVVLTPEERNKGFIRPYRTTYVHTGKRPKHPLRELTEEEKTRYASENFTMFETYPESESPVTGRFWTKEDMESGCFESTVIGRAIAETYAREPDFYGSTFCVTCGKHFPLEEFTWEGTNETVGS